MNINFYQDYLKHLGFVGDIARNKIEKVIETYNRLKEETKNPLVFNYSDLSIAQMDKNSIYEKI